MNSGRKGVYLGLSTTEIKTMVAAFYRYKKQCPVVAFEAWDRLRWGNGQPADVLIITESRMLYEVEVKVTISDLRSDINKSKHAWFTRYPTEQPVYNFYFAVPEEIGEKAREICEERYPYAGLITVNKFPFDSAALNFGVSVVRSAKHLNSKPLSLREIIYVVREQTGTVCRLARDKAMLEKIVKITDKGGQRGRKKNTSRGKVLMSLEPKGSLRDSPDGRDLHRDNPGG